MQERVVERVHEREVAPPKRTASRER